MQESPKPEDEQVETPPVTEKRDERAAWQHDQETHEYYYDDAHGYEKYVPGNDEEEEEEAPKKDLTPNI